MFVWIGDIKRLWLIWCYRSERVHTHSKISINYRTKKFNTNDVLWRINRKRDSLSRDSDLHSEIREDWNRKQNKSDVYDVKNLGEFSFFFEFCYQRTNFMFGQYLKTFPHNMPSAMLKIDNKDCCCISFYFFWKKLFL